MPSNVNDAKLETIRRWLDLALQQVAAESYLHGIDLGSNQQVSGQLLRGNTPINPANPAAEPDQYVRFTQSQTATFLAQYETGAPPPKAGSGFSATLLRRKVADPGAQAGEDTLAFRSTEYKNPQQGGDYDRDGFALDLIKRADGEIALDGFAQGQIAAMEAYYQSLKLGITSTDPENTAQLNVTGKVNAAVRDFFASSANQFNVVGYSLGAQLATVFTERHTAVVSQAFTFNAAGRGALARTTPGLESARLEDMYAYFNSVLANPDAAGGRAAPPAAGGRARFPPGPDE